MSSCLYSFSSESPYKFLPVPKDKIIFFGLNWQKAALKMSEFSKIYAKYLHLTPNAISSKITAADKSPQIF